MQAKSITYIHLVSKLNFKVVEFGLVLVVYISLSMSRAYAGRKRRVSVSQGRVQTLDPTEQARL